MRSFRFMDWILWIVAPAVLVLFLALRMTNLVRVDAACEMLKRGGEVIDVRNESEFRAGHLNGAINIPLGELKGSISRFVPDKRTPLLLHCVSGGRSAIATRLLRRQGYQEVQNLGSYGRAAKILKEYRSA